MKTAVKLISLLLVLCPLFLVAQNNKPKDLQYLLQTETKLKGVVEEVKSVANSNNGEAGIHLMLRTDKGAVVEVLLAPEAFLKDMEIKFAKGDKLDITASKIANPQGEGDVYLAREVIRDKNSLVLRDDKGAPVWTWMNKA